MDGFERLVDFASRGDQSLREHVGPVYPHPMEVPLSPERVAWVFWVRDVPESPQALHAALQEHLERALLFELSRSPADLQQQNAPTLDRIVLLSFLDAPLPAPALRAFALSKTDPSQALPEAHWSQVVARLRGEAQQQLGIALGDIQEAFTVSAVTVSEADPVQAALQQTLGDTPWGREPGAYAQALLAILAARAPAARVPRAADLTLDHLRAWEEQLLPTSNGTLRWLPPLVFQAFCDAVGVLASSKTRRVDWAVPETSEEDETTVPPMFRIQEAGSEGFMPVGLELLRYCIMPKQPSETIPPLAEWVQHAFPR